MKFLLKRIINRLLRPQRTEGKPPRRNVQELNAQAKDDIRRLADELKSLGVSVRDMPEDSPKE